MPQAGSRCQENFGPEGLRRADEFRRYVRPRLRKAFGFSWRFRGLGFRVYRVPLKGIFKGLGFLCSFKGDLYYNG